MQKKNPTIGLCKFYTSRVLAVLVGLAGLMCLTVSALLWQWGTVSKLRAQAANYEWQLANARIANVEWVSYGQSMRARLTWADNDARTMVKRGKGAGLFPAFRFEPSSQAAFRLPPDDNYGREEASPPPLPPAPLVPVVHTPLDDAKVAARIALERQLKRSRGGV